LKSATVTGRRAMANVSTCTVCMGADAFGSPSGGCSSVPIRNGPPGTLTQ
jgi:hypothetical protein